VQSGTAPCSLNLWVRQSSSRNIPEDDNLRSQQRHQISGLFKQWYRCFKEVMWKRSWLSLRYHSGKRAKELQNTTNIHHRNSRCPGGDSNPANHEHLLLLEPACSAAQLGTHYSSLNIFQFYDWAIGRYARP
jgi:hypothetical protein